MERERTCFLHEDSCLKNNMINLRKLFNLWAPAPAANSYAAQGKQLPVPKTDGELPTEKRARLSLRYEPPNMSSSATVGTVQSALRSAEAGDTRQLFALYRD